MHNKRIMLVGSGSGGHFYPLIAVAESLQKQPNPPKLYFIGPDPYDAAALQEHDITFIKCAAGKRRKYRSILNFFDVFKTIWGFFQAFYKLLVIYPDIVFSKGGYTSVPVVIAAWLLRIPVLVHDSDAVPGSATKLTAPFATYIGIAYKEAAEFLPADKTALTGIPMRQSVLQPATADARAKLGVSQEKPLILVLGGSQGAVRVNELILETLDELLPHYSIIHQTGVAHFAVVVETAKAVITDQTELGRYHPIQFIDAAILNDAMHAASIIISRAGSGTIHEIAVHGKPSILIPIPEGISHDQRKNAYAYARTGAASVIEEKNMRDGLLAAEINRIMSDQRIYGEMSSAATQFAPRNAADTIAKLLSDIAEGHT